MKIIGTIKPTGIIIKAERRDSNSREAQEAADDDLEDVAAEGTDAHGGGGGASVAATRSKQTFIMPQTNKNSASAPRGKQGGRSSGLGEIQAARRGRCIRIITCFVELNYGKQAVLHYD